MSIIGIAKTGVGAAATAAGKLDGWAKEAEQAIADGKSVNMFKKALSGIQFFGQANAALQIVAMGLTAIAMLTGAKSEEDQILDGVNQILGRLATMETDIDNKFKELKIFLNLQTTQIQLQPFLVPIETANGYLQQITSLRAKQQGFSTLETQLGQFNTTVFSNAMTQIRDSCVGSGTQTAPNVLDAVYDMSYGNLTSVWAMGEFLLHNATMALMLHGIVAGIQGKPTNTDVDLSQIASIYQDHLADVASAVEQRVNRCVAAADIEKCLARFISDKRSNPLNILVSDKQGTSGRITDALQGQYDYLNFSAIVYRTTQRIRPPWRGRQQLRWVLPFSRRYQQAAQYHYLLGGSHTDQSSGTDHLAVSRDTGAILSRSAEGPVVGRTLNRILSEAATRQPLPVRLRPRAGGEQGHQP